MIWAGNLVKFVLGVILAIAILTGSGVAVALYFMYRGTTHPPKPVFANEKGMVKAEQSPSPKIAKSTSSSTLPSTPEPTASETPSAKPLEPGAYRARVTWQQGLILRTEPSLNAERTGGIDYNQQVVVLEDSADKNWQRIRLEDSEQQGWVKAGNLERVEAEQ